MPATAAGDRRRTTNADQARQRRPYVGARWPAGPVEPVSRAVQQDGQEGDRGGDRHERDEQAAVADGADRRDGTTTSASRPTATVVPLNTTARPAVAMVAALAASGCAPRRRFSRQRIITSSE